MLSDEEIAKIRRSADRYHEVPACFASDMLDEIARLRAENDRLRDENEKLRAARLSPETVAVIRVLLGHLEHCDVTPEVLDDWWRCYPEEV